MEDVCTEWTRWFWLSFESHGLILDHNLDLMGKLTNASLAGEERISGWRQRRQLLKQKNQQSPTPKKSCRTPRPVWKTIRTTTGAASRCFATTPQRPNQWRPRRFNWKKLLPLKQPKQEPESWPKAAWRGDHVSYVEVPRQNLIFRVRGMPLFWWCKSMLQQDFKCLHFAGTKFRELQVYRCVRQHAGSLLRVGKQLDAPVPHVATWKVLCCASPSILLTNWLLWIVFDFMSVLWLQICGFQSCPTNANYCKLISSFDLVHLDA